MLQWNYALVIIKENIDKGNFVVSRRYRELFSRWWPANLGSIFAYPKASPVDFNGVPVKLWKTYFSKTYGHQAAVWNLFNETLVKRRSRGFYAFRRKIPRHEVADFSCGSTDVSHQPVSWIHNLVYQHEQRVGRKMHAKERAWGRKRERGERFRPYIEHTTSHRHKSFTRSQQRSYGTMEKQLNDELRRSYTNYTRVRN